MRVAGAWVALMLAATACGGCASTSWLAEASGSGAPRRGEPAAPSEVRIGMSPKQVEEVLGRPDMIDGESAEAPIQIEVWYYEDAVVVFRGGRVEFVRRLRALPA